MNDLENPVPSESSKRSPSLEERRLALEERKFDLDSEIRRGELKLRLKEGGWTSRLFSPLTTTILAGILTVAGSVVAALVQGQQTLRLEQQKFEATKQIEIQKEQHDLITRMVAVGNEKQALDNVKFLAKYGLISDPNLASRLAEAQTVPVLPPASFSPTQTGTIPPAARLHILAIGIGEYGENARDWTRAVQDSQLGKGLYATVVPTLLLNANVDMSNIIRAVNSLIVAMNPDDTVVILFSGYAEEIDGEFYLLPLDVNRSMRDRVRDSAIRGRDFESYVRRLADRGRVLVLLDTCLSARAEKVLEGWANATVLMCKAAQALDAVHALDKGVERQKGPFIAALIDALSGANADTNRDGLISMSELVSYVGRRVTELSRGRQNLALVQRFEGNIFATSSETTKVSGPGSSVNP